MSEDLSREWMYRVMEIRKDPSIATPEDIAKLATDYIYSVFSAMPRNPIADLAQILTNQGNIYGHESK